MRRFIINDCGGARSDSDKNRGAVGPFYQPTVKCPADPSTSRALQAFTAIPGKGQDASSKLTTLKPRLRSA